MSIMVAFYISREREEEEEREEVEGQQRWRERTTAEPRQPEKYRTNGFDGKLGEISIVLENGREVGKRKKGEGQAPNERKGRSRRAHLEHATLHHDFEQKIIEKRRQRAHSDALVWLWYGTHLSSCKDEGKDERNKHQREGHLVSFHHDLLPSPVSRATTTLPQQPLHIRRHREPRWLLTCLRELR